MPKRKKRVPPEELRAKAFKRRSAQMFSNQKRRARDASLWLDYTLEELRYLISAALKRGTCPYCQGELTAMNFGGDHKHPVARGGAHGHANLLICCMDCNAAKGPLDFYEFRELMAVMGNWMPMIRKNTLARLKAGARVAKLPPIPQDLLRGADDQRLGKNRGEDNKRPGREFKVLRSVMVPSDAHHVIHAREEARHVAVSRRDAESRVSAPDGGD